MRRLYLRIYLAVLASLVAFALLASLAWHAWQRDAARPGVTPLAAQVAAELLPPGAPPEALRAALQRWHARTGADLTLRDASERLIAAAGAPLPAQPPEARSDWRRFWRGPPAVAAMTLPDGRILLLSRPRRGPPGPPRVPGFVVMLALIALAVGVGAYPVVRRLTRRIESLQHTVEAVGAGDLSARAPVHGRDEVAALAESFNHSADRIEALLRAQKSLLANASHELRSPLARIRMAVALIGPQADASIRDELARNVAELDELVGEILLASRLDAIDPSAARDGWEEVDLTALAAEECARAGARLEVERPGSGRLGRDEPDRGGPDRDEPGQDSPDQDASDLDGPNQGGPDRGRPDRSAASAWVFGDPKLLRRLIRNLLDNARRHGGGAPAQVRVAGGRDTVTLDVLDRGPGVPDEERERIFEPFYRVRGASERAGGVGLGLALVRQIARHHGGSVACLARDGGGSRFRTVLPPSPSPARAADRPAAKDSLRSGLG